MDKETAPRSSPAAAFACLWASAALWAGPAVEVSPRILDFGERGHGETARLTFTLRNAGPQGVTIEGIEPCCSSIEVAPRAGGRFLAPGETARFEVTMRSGRALGTLSKWLSIHVAGSADPIRIPVRMRVFPGLELAPRELRFAGEAGGRPETRVVEVRPRGSARLPPLGKVLVLAAAGGAESRERYFQVRAKEVGRALRVEVTLLPEHPEGPVRSVLRLELGGRHLEVPLTGRVFKGIKVVPAQFNFNRVAAARPDTLFATVELISIDGRPFEVSAIRTRSVRWPGPPPAFRVCSRSLDGGKRWRIEAGFPAAAALRGKGTFFGTIAIETDHPLKPVCEVPFFGFFP